MTRYDITPVLDEEDGWHGDDHYTGPRPIPSVSPLAQLLTAGLRVWRVARAVAAALLLIAATVVLVVVLTNALNSFTSPGWGNPASKVNRKPAADTTGWVQRYLVQHGAAEDRAQRVASTLFETAKAHDVDVALLTAIVTVENPVLNSRARSRAGAVGLMQVMPFWRRDRVAQRRCGGTDLTDDAVNLCFGVHVLKFTMRSRRTLPGALLYYNGCRSPRSPCGQYARIVLHRRSQLDATRMAQEESE